MNLSVRDSPRLSQCSYYYYKYNDVHVHSMGRHIKARAPGAQRQIMMIMVAFSSQTRIVGKVKFNSCMLVGGYRARFLMRPPPPTALWTDDEGYISTVIVCTRIRYTVYECFANRNCYGQLLFSYCTFRPGSLTPLTWGRTDTE